MTTAPLQYAVRVPSPSASAPLMTFLHESTFTTVTRMLDSYPPTTLAEMDGVALLNRVDTEYLLSASHLAALLPPLAPDDRMLEIDGRRAHRYRTLYFDTVDLALYRRHHDGCAVRCKVRSQLYIDTGLAYFEIKARNNKGRTLKHRLRTAAPLTSVTPEAQAKLAAYLPVDERNIGPTLWNDFTRITLVGSRSAERLTLNLGVRFNLDGRTAILPNEVIAEVKQNRADHGSPFMQHMRSQGVGPSGVSKYCLGVAMLAPSVKWNAFKEKLRAIEKIAKDAMHVR